MFVFFKVIINVKIYVYCCVYLLQDFVIQLQKPLLTFGNNLTTNKTKIRAFVA